MAGYGARSERGTEGLRDSAGLYVGVRDCGWGGKIEDLDGAIHQDGDAACRGRDGDVASRVEDGAGGGAQHELAAGGVEGLHVLSLAVAAVEGGGGVDC